MKLLKIILLLFATGMVMNGYSQVIYNGSFEEHCGAYSEINPFNTSCSAGTVCSGSLVCVSEWRGSHGTPEIQGGGHIGSNCALMWCGYVTGTTNVIGEGIFTNVCFTHGSSYRISMWVRVLSTALSNLKIYAASGLTPSSIATGDPIPTGISGELLYNTGVSSTTWTQIFIDYTPSSSVAVRNQLWIYPDQPNANIAYVYIDGIEITKSTCCPYSFLYQNNSALPPNTNVTSYIRAGNNVGSPFDAVGDVILSSGNKAYFRAGDYISLEPGFLAAYGSDFLSVITPCTSATNCNYNSTCADILVRMAQVDFSDVVIPDSSIVDATDIKVYPSPTNGKLFIDLIPAKDISISVTNLMGIALSRIEYHDILYETKEIDLSKLPDGIYIISINRDGIVKKETVTVMK